jgi:hypothetical protein
MGWALTSFPLWRNSSIVSTTALLGTLGVHSAVQTFVSIQTEEAREGLAGIQNLLPPSCVPRDLRADLGFVGPAA